MYILSSFDRRLIDGDQQRDVQAGGESRRLVPAQEKIGTTAAGARTPAS